MTAAATSTSRRKVVLAAVLLISLAVAKRSGALEQVWGLLTGHNIPVSGAPVAATHGKLSEHNLEWLKTQQPQQQAEFLLGAAINHDEGATNAIAALVDGWHGHLRRTKKWQDLEMTALYSNDLRVRAAAIEVNLAVNNLDKTDEQVSRLIEGAEQIPTNRPWMAWELGMLANRGVQPQRIHNLLVSWLHDSDQQTRYWAVEGLAHMGTDQTINDFLAVFRDEVSADVRERAGCSLAKSGMLTREQRMKAVPGLLDLAEDSALNATTRGWVYQALREISDQSIPNDPGAWRDWYAAHGSERAARFHQGEQQQVLGNN